MEDNLTDPDPVTFSEFFRSFKDSSGLLAGLSILPALLSELKPNWSAYIFPPLGSLEPAARIGTVLFGLLAIACGYLLIGTSRIRTIIYSSSLVALCCLLAYLSATAMYVRKIDIASQALPVFVTIGSQRSDLARKVFPNETDWQMLRDRGLSDEEIYRLWTPRSVLLGRLAVYVSYLGIVLGWAFTFSSLLAFELSRKHLPKERSQHSI